MNKQLANEANNLFIKLFNLHRETLKYDAPYNPTHQQRLYYLRDKAYRRLQRRLGIEIYSNPKDTFTITL